ncbi:MAG: thiolase [Desulfuromonas sp.]|nr:MAG: thiolase [Desulfuromonas sp.]
MTTRFRPRPVYLNDSFMLPVGRYNGKHREKMSFMDLAASVNQLLDKSDISRDQIDCVVVGSQNPFAFAGVDNVAAKIAGILDISGVKSLLVDTASSSGATAFESGYLEIASGRHDNVLVIGIQSMSAVTTAEATRIVAGVIDREEAEFGLTMPACGALVAQALMSEFNLDSGEWTDFSARLTERAQAFAARNPEAHLCHEIPRGKYLDDIEKGRNYLYYEPLRYYDFCPMSDGVAACLLSATEQDVLVSGLGAGTDIPTIADRKTYTTFPATVIAMRQTLGMAGLTDIEQLAGKTHINMHDPFNGFGPINLVDLGIVPRERLLEGLLDTTLTGENGSYPTNLTGGLKGRGHPLGATGLIQVVENHRLIRDGRFQAGLSHSIGGPINNNVVILLEETEHYQNRPNTPYRPPGMPELSRMKPPGIKLESLFNKRKKSVVRKIAATTHFDFKTGDPTSTLLLFKSEIDGTEFRFLIAVDPIARQALEELKTGDRMELRQDGEQLMVNDIQIRRLYRKTLGGFVELADSAIKRFRRPAKKS